MQTIRKIINNFPEHGVVDVFSEYPTKDVVMAILALSRLQRAFYTVNTSSNVGRTIGGNGDEENGNNGNDENNRNNENAENNGNNGNNRNNETTENIELVQLLSVIRNEQPPPGSSIIAQIPEQNIKPKGSAKRKPTVKVSKFQNEFMKLLFLPKYGPKL